MSLLLLILKQILFACSCVIHSSLDCWVNDSLLFITCDARKGGCGVTAAAPGRQSAGPCQLEGPSSPEQETGSTSTRFPPSPPTYPQQAGKYHLLGSLAPSRAHRFLKTSLQKSGSRGWVVRWHSLKMIWNHSSDWNEAKHNYSWLQREEGDRIIPSEWIFKWQMKFSVCSCKVICRGENNLSSTHKIMDS